MADDNAAADAGAARNQDPAAQRHQEPPKTYTQDDFNALDAKLKREYGAKAAELKKKADLWDKAEKASLSEIEKLKLDVAEKDKTIADLQGKLTGFELEKVKLTKLTDAGLSPSDLEWITGTTEEEIVASVTKLAARLKVTPPTAAQGAGNNGVQNQNQGQKKIWTQAEIRELRTSGKMTDELHAEIIQATKEGRVQ